MVGRCGYAPLPVKERFYRPFAKTISFSDPLNWRIEGDSNSRKILFISSIAFQAIAIDRSATYPLNSLYTKSKGM